MRKKIQILIIHGGMTFKNDQDYLRYLKTKTISKEKRNSWKGEYLEHALSKGFEIISPQMPLKQNAKYRDWKIFFERNLELLGKNFILIGESLGGVFLAKYLSQNRLAVPALSTYLICAPFDDSLPDEDLVGGFALTAKSNLSLIAENTKHLHLLFSKDDKVVPVSQAKKYKEKLKSADIVIFKSKNGHFKISKFPEIVKMIKKDAN
jgi:predicted alpha/beta hydrolase family esterase